LARHEGDIRADAGEALSLHDLLDLLSASGEQDLRKRQEAIACYLSGSEGWREAVKQLGGAFADEERLRERKPD
jgi:hypothetical protein